MSVQEEGEEEERKEEKKERKKREKGDWRERGGGKEGGEREIREE